MENFLEIISKPDNIPIIGMIFMVAGYTWLGLKQARKHDRLIEQGSKDEVLRRMQE